MYKIKLYVKTIHRNHISCNRELDGKILKITRQEIGTYMSESIPNVGDVIWYNNNCYYDVCKVIRKISPAFHPLETQDSQSIVILEVCKHSNKQYYSHGSDAWYEEVPLVTEISYEE